MKKERTKQITRSEVDEDTMRPEYDFSKAVRGVTAKRYAQGTNVVVLDPDVVRLFPNATAVNEALRALGGIIQRTPRSKGRKHLTTA
jgi:Trm5-related predicted tRNA methylase